MCAGENKQSTEEEEEEGEAKEEGEEEAEGYVRRRKQAEHS